MISHTHKAIFVHVPKTAGTSMRGYFRSHGFAPVEYHAPDGSNDNITKVYIRGTSWRIKRNLEDVWGEYFKFAFVRNPWDRLVSCWKNRAPRYKSFSSFLDAHPWPETNQQLIWHTLSQLTHICDTDGKLIVDYVGRFENLQEDLDVVCDKLGVPGRKLPHINKSEHKPYWEYYTDSQQRFVYGLYRQEIEYFGYEFGE